MHQFVKDQHSFSKPNDAVAKHLDLDIKVDFESQSISGKATWTIDNTSKGKEIIFDENTLNIAKVTLGDDERVAGRRQAGCQHADGGRMMVDTEHAIQQQRCQRRVRDQLEQHQARHGPIDHDAPIAQRGADGEQRARPGSGAQDTAEVVEHARQRLRPEGPQQAERDRHDQRTAGQPERDSFRDRYAALAADRRPAAAAVQFEQRDAQRDDQEDVADHGQDQCGQIVSAQFENQWNAQITDVAVSGIQTEGGGLGASRGAGLRIVVAPAGARGQGGAAGEQEHRHRGKGIAEREAPIAETGRLLGGDDPEQHRGQCEEEHEGVDALDGPGGQQLPALSEETAEYQCKYGEGDFEYAQHGQAWMRQSNRMAAGALRRGSSFQSGWSS